MKFSKNTLHNWLKKCKEYIDELVCVLKSIALEKDSIVNCDEVQNHFGYQPMLNSKPVN